MNTPQRRLLNRPRYYAILAISVPIMLGFPSDGVSESSPQTGAQLKAEPPPSPLKADETPTIAPLPTLSPPVVSQERPSEKVPSLSKSEEHGPWYVMPDWWIAIATGLLWIYTALLRQDNRRQVDAAVASAEAANNAATAAVDAVRATREAERPWIKLDAEICTPFTFAGGQARITLEFKMENVGKTPALHVWAHGVMRHGPIFQHQKDFQEIIDQHQHTVDLVGSTVGVVIFPGQTTVLHYAFDIPRNEMPEDGRIERGGISINPPEISNLLTKPTIVGVVFYSSNYTMDTYRTPFHFDVIGRDANYGSVLGRFPIDLAQSPLRKLL